jgi:4-amino-4-deoxychorismate lyase
MCRLLETIQVKNGRLRHLPYHQRRFNAARRTLWGLPETDLAARINVPERLGPGPHKCRVVYGPEVKSVAFEPYVPRAIRSLRLVEGGRIDYCFKYADRRALQALFDQRAGCDDILIVQEGKLTDTSYSNIALYVASGG